MRKKKSRGRVPVILQMEALECGAASLCMVLAYYKKWIPLEQVRRDCGVSRDGSNAKNIIRAARSYGMEAKAYRCQAEFLKKSDAPLILHWNFNHFVVLEGFRGDKAVINDPAQGKIQITMEELEQSFTGICLACTPREDFVREGSRESIWKFIKSRLGSSGSGLIFVMAASLLTALGEIAALLLGRIFIDLILPENSGGWMSSLIQAIFLLALFQLTAHTLSSRYLTKVKGKLSMVSQAQFMWHILRLPMEFFSQRMAGDLAIRQKENEEVAEILVSCLAPVVIHFLLALSYVAVMLPYSVPLTVIGLLTVALQLILAGYVSRKRVDLARTQIRDEGKLQAMTVNGIEMMENLRSAGAEGPFLERWSGTLAEVNHAQVSADFMNSFFRRVPELLQEISSTVVLCFGALLVMEQSFTAGMVLTFQGLLLSFYRPVQSLVESGQKLQEMRSSMERIGDVMNYEEIERRELQEGEEGLSKLSGKVELRHVTFGYSRLAPPLLKDFSLQISPGTKVALVGFSGCGKSTLAKLISGFYEPWSGEILFDGKPGKEYPEEVFKGSVAVVDQDITLFQGTVADNIKLWDESIEDFEMILAARDAGIHEDIMQRENGYQTEVAEGGRNFSGGQRQRFEIAHALAQDPTILILDEATSALDAVTEYEVAKAIQDRGITCIIVAHRLSTIRDCDEILVLDQGEVIERGTHEELWKQGGLYTRLVSTE